MVLVEASVGNDGHYHASTMNLGRKIANVFLVDLLVVAAVDLFVWLGKSVHWNS